MPVHPGLHRPHLHTVNRDLNTVMKNGQIKQYHSTYLTICSYLEIYKIKVMKFLYSVISSGDDEGNISELTVCWKLELLGSQEITAEVEVMLAAWR